MLRPVGKPLKATLVVASHAKGSQHDAVRSSNAALTDSGSLGGDWRMVCSLGNLIMAA